MTEHGDADPAALQACPRCGGSAIRVRRHLTDRLISIVVAVQRYRCDEVDCDWEGRVRVSRLRTKADARHDR